MFNVFQYLREYNVDLSNETLIKFEVANTLEAYYCVQEKARGEEPYYAVDGKKETAWANLYTHNESEQYFIIDFVERTVALKSFTIDTLCNPPVEIYLYASNNKNEWVTLKHVTEPLKNYSSNTYEVINHHSYHYFSFNQTISSGNDYRLILHNIEFYGTFGHYEIQTCKTEHIFKLNLIYIYILIK